VSSSATKELVDSREIRSSAMRMLLAAEGATANDKADHAPDSRRRHDLGDSLWR